MNNSFAHSFRQRFPLINNPVNGRNIIYFDNGATTQKPINVIEALDLYYRKYNSNVHRAAHSLSATATSQFEQTRQQLQRFINAKSTKEIIWTSGTTASINLVATSWGESFLTKGDEIVLSVAEHHANIVPWQQVAAKTGAVIRYLELDANGRYKPSELDTMITAKTKLVSISHCSNVTGKITDVDAVIAKARSVGAKTLLDGAQFIAHKRIDVQQLDCDFYVFSAHKMFGPTGVGVLYGKQRLLEQMPPINFGGEMIKKVTLQETTFNQLPYKFEAGTPNIAGIIAFSAAISLVAQTSNETHELSGFEHYEQQLTNYCYNKLLAIKALNFVVDGEPDIPVFSFNLLGHHQQDVASFLDAKGIAVRAGHHCAMPLMQYLDLEGCIRVSLCPYNTLSEVDNLIDALTEFLALADSPGSSDTTIPSKTKLPNTGESIKEPCVDSTAQIDATTRIIDNFRKAKGWDGKHREIMLLGKTLPRLAKQYRNDDTLISGCESKAWLQMKQGDDGLVYLVADSDARVVRGLLAIVLAAYNGKSAQQIKKFDVAGYFEKLGLMQHLSPSRGNGLNAIIDKIVNASVN